MTLFLRSAPLKPRPGLLKKRDCAPAAFSCHWWRTSTVRAIQLFVTPFFWSLATVARAQDPTSAAISGRILDASGRGLPGVEVAVTNAATGISMRGISLADGRYRIGGLDVGGPYSVSARRIGLPRQTRAGLYLSLGQQLHVDLVLEREPVTLSAVETRGRGERAFSRAHTGAEGFLSDSMLRQLPVINRDLYDLVRLIPQTSTWFPLTASGAGPRVNNIRIDGVGDQAPASNLAAGALYGGHVIPLDAVKEYQVLFSPYDVRHGGFAGASVNVVTRSGSNDASGSVFAFGTSERLGRDVPFVRRAQYEKAQFGGSLGGPIIRDRLFAFVSAEHQRRQIVATGPHLGASPASQSALPVSAADISRFQQLLAERGLDGGTAGAVTNPNPSSSFFLRLDAPVPRWNSRVVVRGSYGYADSSIFARPTDLAPTNCSTTACFALSSLQHSRWVTKRSTAVQFMSNFASGAYNELLLGHMRLVAGFRPSVDQPLILVNVAGASGVPAVLQSGTHEIATGQRTANSTAELTDNLSISAGPHRFTFGLSSQWFDLTAFQLRGSYGVWEFSSLDALQAGAASRYRVTRDTGSVTAASGAHHSVYVSDVWEASSRLSLTMGLRGDVSMLVGRPPYVPTVDSTFHLRTDNVPSRNVVWSPRLGFNYQLSQDANALAQLRGGVGLFTGRPPLFWLFGGFSAYGLAARTLQCGALPTDAGLAPAFQTDFRNPPLACAGGQSFAAATKGEIDVLDARLRTPQTLRASLAVDAALPFGVIGTIEGLYTRATRAVFFSPINLREPDTFDRHGRLMYGAIRADGVAIPSRQTPEMGDVIRVSNQSRDYATDITVELRKRSRVADADASISFGKSRDAQSPRTVSAILADNWRLARPVMGRQNDLSLGTSDFDQPLRVRAFGTVHSPWRKLATDVSFLYVGGSGFPFTYVAGGPQGRGDLNADGAVGNDPIYIPRTAFDTTEISFSGTQTEVAAQQVAFERFIDGSTCLHSQRGKIMTRNSCRSPWMNLTNLAVRQALPTARGQSLGMEFQIFNVLNLLNPRWGRVQVPTGATLASTSQVLLLSQVGATTGPQAQPRYAFNPTMPRYNADNFDTYYQIQLAVRYNF